MNESQMILHLEPVDGESDLYEADAAVYGVRVWMGDNCVCIRVEDGLGDYAEFHLPRADAKFIACQILDTCRERRNPSTPEN